MTTGNEERPPRIFLSYSRKDAKYRSELTTHLGVLKRGQRDIYPWTDETIRGGENWLRAIRQGLANAEIVVLLVSAHALTSDFILDEEVAKGITAQKCIFPILVRDCAWQEVAWLSERQMRPLIGEAKKLRPLNTLSPAGRDAAWSMIARELAKLLKDKPQAPDAPRGNV